MRVYKHIQTQARTYVYMLSTPPPVDEYTHLHLHLHQRVLTNIFKRFLGTIEFFYARFTNVADPLRHFFLFIIVSLQVRLDNLLANIDGMCGC